MKKIILTIIFSLLLINCDNFRCDQKTGIIIKKDTILQYDPVVHMFTNIYKYQININDTIVSIETDAIYNTDDTLTFYIY